MWMLISAALAAETGLVGHFVVDEPWPEVEAKHAAAVDASVKSFPWAFRGLARPFLTRAVWSCGELTLDNAADHLAIRCDDKPALALPLDGSGVPFTKADGGQCTAILDITTAGMEVHFACDGGAAHVTYTREPDGKLTVGRTLSSPRVAVPMAWSVRYRAE